MAQSFVSWKVFWGLYAAGYRWGHDGEHGVYSRAYGLIPPDHPNYEWNVALEDVPNERRVWTITEEWWRNFPWNPYRRWDWIAKAYILTNDARAGPKPTWAQVVAAVNAYRLTILDFYERENARVLERATIDHASPDSHVYVDGVARPMLNAGNPALAAKNAVRAKADALVVTMKDPDGGLAAGATDAEKLAARIAALDSYDDITENIDTHFAALLAEDGG